MVSSKLRTLGLIVLIMNLSNKAVHILNVSTYSSKEYNLNL